MSRVVSTFWRAGVGASRSSQRETAKNGAGSSGRPREVGAHVRWAAATRSGRSPHEVGTRHVKKVGARYVSEVGAHHLKCAVGLNLMHKPNRKHSGRLKSVGLEISTLKHSFQQRPGGPKQMSEPYGATFGRINTASKHKRRLVGKSLRRGWQRRSACVWRRC